MYTLIFTQFQVLQIKADNCCIVEVKRGNLSYDIKVNTVATLSLTFGRTIGSGHNNNTVQEQILKKLLKNHGVSDVSHLKQNNQFWENH